MMTLREFEEECNRVGRERNARGLHHKVHVLIDHASFRILNEEFSKTAGTSLTYKVSIEFEIIENTTDWFIEIT